MDAWLMYGVVLFIAYLTALLWRRRSTSSKAKDCPTDSEGAKSLNERENPRYDIGQETNIETLAAISRRVDEDDKIEQKERSVVSEISPEELEPPGKSDEFSGNDNTNESENIDIDLVKSSKSVETEVAKDICKEPFDKSGENHSADAVLCPEGFSDDSGNLCKVSDGDKSLSIVSDNGNSSDIISDTDGALDQGYSVHSSKAVDLSFSTSKLTDLATDSYSFETVRLNTAYTAQDRENSLLFVESVEAQKENLLCTPTNEVCNKAECDDILKELQGDRASEESQSLQEKAESFGESALATDLKIESDKSKETSKQQLPNAESSGISFEEATLETDDGVESALADKLPEGKFLRQSTDTLEEKETFGEESGTAEEKIAPKVSLKVEEKWVTSTEASDTLEVRESFGESLGREDENLIQQSTQTLEEHETSPSGSFPFLKLCGESLNTTEEKELSLEERTKIIDYQSDVSSKQDKELSQVDPEKGELRSSVELVLATQTQEQLTEEDALQKELEELSQEQIVEVVITKGNILQTELAQEKAAQKEQLQEELLGENEIAGEPLIAHSEALQETLPDTLQPIEDKKSLEEIVEAPSDQSNTLDKFVGVSENSFYDREPEFCASCDSETTEATPTVFCSTEWQDQQNLGADKPDASWDQALFNLSKALSSAACADRDRDFNTGSAKGLLHSDFSRLEKSEEFSVAHSLKHDTTSSENKENVVDAHLLVDVEEKLILVDSAIEAGQQPSLEGFSDNSGNLCIVSDTDKGLVSISDNSSPSDIISDTDGTLNRGFSVRSIEAVDLSLSTSRLTDSATDSYSFETGRLNTAFTAESPLVDTETVHLAEDNLFQEADKDLQNYDHGIPNSCLNRQSVEISLTEPTIVASQTLQVQQAVGLQENTALLGEAPERSADNSSKTGALVCSSSRDVADVASAVELEQGKEISGERDNIREIPGNESSDENSTPERTRESKKILGILADENDEKHQEILNIPEEKDSLEIQNILEIFGDETSQKPQVVLELSCEKSSEKLQQVPEILSKDINERSYDVLEILAEKGSQEPQLVPEILSEEINQEFQEVCEISSENDRPELQKVEKVGQELRQGQETLGEEITREPPKVLEILAEKDSQELHEVPQIFCEENGQEHHHVLDISLAQSSKNLLQAPKVWAEEIGQKSLEDLEASTEWDSEEPAQVPGILDEAIGIEPPQCLDISLLQGTEKLREVHTILGEELSQEHQEVAEISLKESDQELKQVSDILSEEISQPSQKVLDISLGQSSVELYQVQEFFDKEITQEHLNAPEISADNNTQRLHQISDIVSEEIIPEPGEVQEFPLGESCEEICKVSDIFREGTGQEPQKFAEISQGENWQELQIVQEIFGELICEEVQKVTDDSLGDSCEETCKVPEIFGEEISQVLQNDLKTSLDKNSEEFQQDPQILGEEISRVAQKVEERSLEAEEVSPDLGEEISEEPVNVPKTLSDKDIQEFHQVSDIAGEEIIQDPQKVQEFSLEKSSQKDPEVLSEEISLLPQKVLEFSLLESREIPDILLEEICKEPQDELEVSAERDSQALQQLPGIFGEAIDKEPLTVLDISLELNRKQFHQVQEPFDGGLCQESQTVAEISLKERNQELCQVAKFFGEEITEEPQKITDILTDKETRELIEISDIIGEEIIQEPRKVQKISQDTSCSELKQDLECPNVSEIFGGEISQEPQAVLDISIEQSSQELHQVPETFDEEITQKSPKVSKLFGGDINQEPQGVVGIYTEQSSQELHQVPEILGEDIAQESSKVSKILGGEIHQEPQGVLDISIEQSSQELQVPETFDEEITQKSSTVSKIFGGEISQEPQRVVGTYTEQSSQELHQVRGCLGEDIAQVSLKVTEILGEEIAKESPKVTEILGGEIGQEPQRVLGTSLEHSSQVPENLVGEITRDPVKVLDISAEGYNQEPEKDFTEDIRTQLVDQLKMTAPIEVLFLVLNLDENNESEVFRLKKGWTLKFFLGPTLVNSAIRLFVNHPLQGEMWDKNSYRELQWSHHLPSLRLDVCEGHADVKMIQAGSFRYFFTVDGSNCKDRASGRGFFLVDPDLVIGKSQEILPLDGIICQTVLSKLLGPFPEWEGRLRVAKETGYNVIHFTPLQELGASNSAYALKEQLTLNPVFHTSDTTFTFEDVERLVEVLNNEYGILSFTDLVLNHTANESPWIFEHPECVFNLVNSPYLKPAYLLDRCLQMFSANVADGAWVSEGIPPTLNSEEHLDHITTVLHTSVLPELQLSEFYQVSVDEILNSFRRLIVDGFSGGDDEESKLQIIPDPGYSRMRSTVNMSVAIKLFYNNQTSDVAEDEKMELAVNALRRELERLNARADAVVSEHLLTAVRNFVAHARHRFVDANGLRLPAVTREQPIMSRYFVNSFGYLSMEEEEKLMHSEKAAYCMAHNGWAYDAQRGNFVEPGSNVYLRRELSAWDDSVKLRYGDSPDDCPYLWELMHKYAIQTARIFHGIRLDNCHNTPIHVAEWMLAECRAVRPDLYVMAELFTSSKHFDNLYVNRLGLSSMIQEALSASNAHDLSSRLVRHSSEPVGAFFQLPLRPLTSSLTHDMLYDQTHDNPSIVDQWSVHDVLPNAALVSMARCSIASTRGYEEVVPHHISVITDSRLYRSWSTDEFCDSSSCIGIKTGIIAAKRALNKLHWKLMSEGFSQMSVEHLTDDIVVVTRHHPITHESIVLVAHTVFQHHDPDSEASFIPSLPVQGRLSEVIVEAEVVTDATKAFVPNDKYICGLDNIQLIIRENIDITESHMVRVQSHDNSQTVEFVRFPASSVIAFRVSLDDFTNVSLTRLHNLLACYGRRIFPPSTDASVIVATADRAELEEIFTELTLNDLNLVLFRCDVEERDDGYGYGVYNVPGFGDLPFCGLAGVMSVLMAIRASNNLDHPLCRNLKEGNWMLDYLSSRLLYHPGTKRLGTWLEAQFGHIKSLPRCLVPCYFDALVTSVFVALEELTWNKMPGFVKDGSTFVRALALASVQVCGFSRSASLPVLSPLLDPPIPTAEGHPQMDCVTIAAGLPHFSSGSFRSWGRDTFISMRGLLLVTGRFNEARVLILAFAGCLRHGLIPNFLGCGSLEPRYNSRDAVWWWLQAIQDYCNMAPHGIAILKDRVSRCYPTDDSQLLPPGSCDQLLCDVIQEALQKHASGVKFRERNAGPKIDNDMTSAGFDVEFGIDWTTGFVFGGNEHNCGTWMDKMGSSEVAGNLGKPATPRHGSAVEIVGLCYSAVKWLDDLSVQSLFPYSGVSVLQDGVVIQVTYRSWCDLIAKNFEPKFWIDCDPSNDPNPELVNRRGIYRDVFRCSHKWSDYQLRPNFAISVALAPELCNIDHAWAALERAGDILLGPLGLKTLDPSDWEYSGFYDNSHWSIDYKTASGFSYHQGPEWIWPVGFFLRAMLQVAKRLEDQHSGILKDTLSNVRRILSAHHTFIHVSAWKSLPELTNENGEFCASSCPSQAWSIACILDSLYDAEKITPINDHDQIVPINDHDQIMPINDHEQITPINDHDHLSN